MSPNCLANNSISESLSSRFARDATASTCDRENPLAMRNASIVREFRLGTPGPDGKAPTRSTQRLTEGHSPINLPCNSVLSRWTPCWCFLWNMSDIRPAAVAGTWYSANADELAGEVDRYLEGAGSTPSVPNLVA